MAKLVEITTHAEQIARKWERLVSDLEIHLYSHRTPNGYVSSYSFLLGYPGRAGSLTVFVARERESTKARLDAGFDLFPDDLADITPLGCFYGPVRLLLVVEDLGHYWKLPPLYVEEDKLPLTLEYIVILGIFLFLPEHIEEISITQEFQEIEEEWVAWLHNLWK